MITARRARQPFFTDLLTDLLTDLVAGLLACLLACLLELGGTPLLAAEPSGPVVDAVGLTVSDLDHEVELFTGTLGFTRVGADREETGAALERLTGVFGAHTRSARLRLGSEDVELTEYLTPRGRDIPADSRSNDRWFQHLAIVVSDMDVAYAQLRAPLLAHRLRFVSSAPQRLPDWNPDAGGIRAFYFQDPDGHNLEVIWYPPGKGDPRWQQRPPGRVFLGIDHTAIAVADTAASVAFYRDVVGLHVAGASENWGAEQEHLNQVSGAHLRITALRGAAGPGIELLEYLAPLGGRPAPAGAAPNDLAHWHTVVRVGDLEAVVDRAQRQRAGHLASQIVEAEPGEAFRRAAEILDGDGHALLWIER